MGAAVFFVRHWLRFYNSIIQYNFVHSRILWQTIQVWITAVGFPSEMRKIYPDSRIAGICSKLSLAVPPKLTFIIGMFLDIHQNLALVIRTRVNY